MYEWRPNWQSKTLDKNHHRLAATDSWNTRKAIYDAANSASTKMDTQSPKNLPAVRKREDICLDTKNIGVEMEENVILCEFIARDRPG